jgi:nitrite reductase/ring-hydroxylating ferredoxin subunit
MFCLRSGIKVAEIRDIEPTSMKAVDVAGEKVCIINFEGNYYAIGNVCTHMLVNPLIFAIGGLFGARDCLFDTATMSLSGGWVIGQ